MKLARSLFVAALLACAVTFALPAGASAMPQFKYSVSEFGIGSWHSVDRLVYDRKTLVRQVRSGVEIDTASTSNTSFVEFYWNLQPGDEIQVYQVPLADPYPSDPYPTPTETFVVPTLNAVFVAGNAVVAGSVSDGWNVRVGRQPACGDGDSIAASVAGGAFSANLGVPFTAGDYTQLHATSQGDSVRVSGYVPGDSQCIEIDAHAGESTDSKPFEIEAEGLNLSEIPSTRIVLRRAGAVIAEDNDDELDLTVAQRPLPGDVIDVYRPEGAPTPAFSRTVPAISGKFDPAADLVAIDAIESRSIEAWVCRPLNCMGYSERSAFGTPQGRTLFSFATGQSYYGPFDVRPDDLVGGWWESPDSQLEYEWDVSAGDLVAPTGKLTLAKKFAASKLKSRLKFKLGSNEAGNATAKLTIKKRGKRGKKTITRTLTIASLKTRAIIAGNNTLTLTITRSGKKLLKQLDGSTTATLTLTLTDASGNVSKVTKRTKLAVSKK